MVRGVRDALEVPAPQVAAAAADVAHIAKVVGAAELEQGQALGMSDRKRRAYKQ